MPLPLQLRRTGRSGREPRVELPQTDEAVIRIYAARTSGVRAVFAVHLWLVVKPTGAHAFERWDVVGRRARTGRVGLHRNVCSPRESWAGHRPLLVRELAGQAAAAALPGLRAAIAAYPQRDRYRAWPGPNCNSFIAYLARAVPALRTELPALAVGKDYLPPGRLLAAAASGTGWQVSALGLVGVTLAAAEGFELCLGGLVLGCQPQRTRVKLPLLGTLPLHAQRER